MVIETDPQIIRLFECIPLYFLSLIQEIFVKYANCNFPALLKLKNVKLFIF